MAENDMDGGQLDGTALNANQDASDQEGVQQPSYDAARMQATLDALNSGLQTLQKRVDGLQGKKDSEISGLKSKIAEYEKLKEKFGGDGAIEQIELRDTIANMNQTLAELRGSVSPQAPGTGASGALEVAQAIEELQMRELDANDKGFVQLVRDGLTQEKFNEYVVNKTRPQPPASPAGAAGVPALGGSEGKPSAEKVKAMNEELLELYKHPTKNAQKIAALEKELEPTWK